jgi:hypothetical protein
MIIRPATIAANATAPLINSAQVTAPVIIATHASAAKDPATAPAIAGNLFIVSPFVLVEIHY